MGDNKFQLISRPEDDEVRILTPARGVIYTARKGASLQSSGEGTTFHLVIGPALLNGELVGVYMRTAKGDVKTWSLRTFTMAKGIERQWPKDRVKPASTEPVVLSSLRDRVLALEEQVAKLVDMWK